MEILSDVAFERDCPTWPAPGVVVQGFQPSLQFPGYPASREKGANQKGVTRQCAGAYSMITFHASLSRAYL